MITECQRSAIVVSGEVKPIVGLPDGVLKLRARFRVHTVPFVFLRFHDRIQKHLLLSVGDAYEPYAEPEAVNYFPQIQSCDAHSSPRAGSEIGVYLRASAVEK
jgi:hypothetical protein